MHTWDLVLTGGPLPFGPGIVPVGKKGTRHRKAIAMDWPGAVLYINETAFSDQEVTALVEMISCALLCVTPWHTSRERQRLLNRTIGQM